MIKLVNATGIVGLVVVAAVLVAFLLKVFLRPHVSRFVGKKRAITIHDDCPFCDYPIQPGRTTCPECGETYPPPIGSCSCGYPIMEGESRCPECGFVYPYPLPRSTNSQAEPSTQPSTHADDDPSAQADSKPPTPTSQGD